MAAMQIDHESSMESFDERRVNLLKAQLAQLERQAVLLTKALSGHKEKLHSAEGAIQQTLHLLMSNMANSSNRSSVTLSRTDISTQVKILEDALERLSASSAQSEATPWVAYTYTPNTKFLQDGHNTTIADVGNGSLKHLNIVHVTKLEQRLCTLYGDLSGYLIKQQHSNQLIPTTDNGANKTLMSSLQKACEDLQQLSFLVPSAPWAKRQCLAEVTIEDVMRALPKLTYAKHQVVKDLLAAVLKLSEHRYCLLLNKCERLELELGCLRGSETKASAHVRATSTGLLSELASYHESIKETLVTPLQGVLEKFDALSDAPTDENLKLFLQDLKERAPELQQVCQTICAHEMVEDVAKMSDLGYSKKLRKGLKHLKFDKMTLEDRENELLQAEHETRDEVKERIAQLSVVPSKVKVKPFNVSQSKPSKVDSSNRHPTASSPAAATFLSKYEKMENSLHASDSDQGSQSKLGSSPGHSNSATPRQPTWLQEMKHDLSNQSDNSIKADDLSVKSPKKSTKRSVRHQ